MTPVANTTAATPAPDRQGAQDAIHSMHDIFSDDYRSALLCCLEESDGRATVEELGEYLVWRCPEHPLGDDGFTEATRSWLVSNHVERMSAFGVIDFDESEGVVRLADGVTVTVSSPWSDP
jgi:hypothetical protein